MVRLGDDCRMTRVSHWRPSMLFTDLPTTSGVAFAFCFAKRGQSEWRNLTPPVRHLRMFRKVVLASTVIIEAGAFLRKSGGDGLCCLPTGTAGCLAYDTASGSR